MPINRRKLTPIQEANTTCVCVFACLYCGWLLVKAASPGPSHTDWTLGQVEAAHLLSCVLRWRFRWALAIAPAPPPFSVCFVYFNWLIKGAPNTFCRPRRSPRASMPSAGPDCHIYVCSIFFLTTNVYFPRISKILHVYAFEKALNSLKKCVVGVFWMLCAYQ